MKQQIYNTALYCRLSRDDEQSVESSSISTQRQMLRQYANEQGFHIVDEYVDDGWSGLNFDRPSFERMVDDIEDGKINCVITKDLSRLGRNHILTGQYIEMYFPSKNVRYIALNDGIDSTKGENEIVAFKNILNEMVARDTSRKVKSAMRTKFLNGEFIAPTVPLGYKKDPNRKNRLVPNEDTKWIIEKIFSMAAHGAGVAKIQRTLVAEKVPTPSWWNRNKNGKHEFYENADERDKYKWSVVTVKGILENEVYIGILVHNKYGTVSFKNKKLVDRPPEVWLKVENTHEPIISKEMWDTAHAHINARKRPKRDGENTIFAGLLRCPDCGWSLSCAHNNNGRQYYRCTQYSIFGKDRCSSHFISYNLLYGVILCRLQYWLDEVRENAPEILDRLLHTGNRQRETEMKHTEKELKKTERRLKEVDNLFAKMYEDRAAARLDEENYTMLSAKYRSEQQQLKEQAATLFDKMNKVKETRQGVESWLALITKYAKIDELTAPLLNELIDKIEVHHAHKDKNGNTLREINIYYRFVGRID